MKRILSFLLVSAILLPNVYAQGDDISAKIDAIKTQNDILISRASVNLDNLVNRIWNDGEAAYGLTKKLSTLNDKIYDITTPMVTSIIYGSEDRKMICEKEIKSKELVSSEDHSTYKAIQALLSLSCLSNNKNRIVLDSKLPKLLLYSDLARVINEKIEKIKAPLNNYLLSQYSGYSISKITWDWEDGVDYIGYIDGNMNGIKWDATFMTNNNSGDIIQLITEDHFQFWCVTLWPWTGIYEPSEGKLDTTIVDDMIDNGLYSKMGNSLVKAQVGSVVFPSMPMSWVQFQTTNVATGKIEKYIATSDYRKVAWSHTFGIIVKQIDDSARYKWERFMICSAYAEM